MGVDHAGGPVGHQASLDGGWPVAPDDLPERGVEPLGDLGTSVGDAADRSGVAAEAEPAGPTTNSAPASAVASGWLNRWATSSPTGWAARLLGGLDAGGEGGDPSLGGGGGHPGVLAGAWARLRPSEVVASVRVTSRTGRSAAAA